MGVDAERSAAAAAVHSIEDAAVAGSVVVKRFRSVGSRAVISTEFLASRSGSPRRGFIGVVLRDGAWRPSSGWSSNAEPEAADDDIWLNSGGWSNGEWTVHGGWVADASAVLFRATDPAGRVVEDRLEDHIAMLIWEGDLDRGTTGVLVDAAGDVVRSGLVLRPRPRLR